MKFARTSAVMLLALALTATAIAQTAPVTAFTTNLHAPTKIIFTPRGNLIVAEQGEGPNSGRISIIDRQTGTARTLISGLPSGINTLGGEDAPSGPSGLALQGESLYVTIGSGDAAIPGPFPGTEIPSDNPSSPILSSLLVIQSQLPLDEIQGGFALSRAQHDQLKAGQTVSFGSSFATVQIKLVADFPDLRFEPRPDFSGNFRSSNPFGVAVRDTTAYVVDASWNLIHAVNLNTGAFQTLATFPQLSNPTPVGPPMIDPVPDSIQFADGQLLVTALTGFPFPAGVSRIYSVDPNTGAITTRLPGLISAIDAEPLRDPSGNQAFLVLEFSTNQLAGAPGRLNRVVGATGSVVAAPLITPTSMAADLVSGEVFITEIFTGRVMKVETEGIVPESLPPSVLPVIASSTGVGGARFETTIQLTNPYPFAISGTLRLRTPAGGQEASIPYSLAANSTTRINNAMQAFGRTGLGSVDIIPTIGPAPVVNARVFDSVTSNGFYEQPVPASNIGTAGQRFVFVGPPDTTQFRMNMGARTFSGGAILFVTLYGANGGLKSSATHTLPPNTVMQTSAAEFAGGPLAANDSIIVTVINGTAIVYGSVINNTTQASSLQVPSALE